MNQFAKAKGHIKDEIFFEQTVGPDGSRILATVSSIDDNAAQFQTEYAD